MPSELPSSIRLHQGLNAIATAFLRRAFAGAILAERYSVAARAPSREQPAAPGATQRRASSALAGHAKRPYRYLHGATKPGQL